MVDPAPRTGNRFDWTGAPSDALREEWATGLTAGQIAGRLAKRFGFPVTKNMVVGRAFRLDLPARQSPIPGAPSPAPRRKPAPEVVFRPARPQAKPQVVRSPPPVVAAPAPPCPAHAGVPVPVPVPAGLRHGAGCRFPLWGNGRPDHRYCDAPRVVGRDGVTGPYCAAHHARCHMSVAEHRAQQRQWVRDVSYGLKRPTL